MLPYIGLNYVQHEQVDTEQEDLINTMVGASPFNAFHVNKSSFEINSLTNREPMQVFLKFHEEDHLLYFNTCLLF